MLDRITDSQALKHMENDFPFTPIAATIHLAIGIIRALGSIFAENRSKEFSAALAQIAYAFKIINPAYQRQKKLEQLEAQEKKLAAKSKKIAITNANKGAKDAAEAVARKQAKVAAEEALQGVTEGNLKEIAIQAAKRAIDEPAREAAEEAIKDVEGTIGIVASKTAILNAVEAAKAIAAEEAPKGISAAKEAEVAAKKAATSPKKEKPPVTDDACVIS